MRAASAIEASLAPISYINLLNAGLVNRADSR